MLGVTPNIRHCIVNKQVVVDIVFSLSRVNHGVLNNNFLRVTSLTFSSILLNIVVQIDIFVGSVHNFLCNFIQTEFPCTVSERSLSPFLVRSVQFLHLRIIFKNFKLI